MSIGSFPLLQQMLQPVKDASPKGYPMKSRWRRQSASGIICSRGVEWSHIPLAFTVLHERLNPAFGFIELLVA